MPQMRTQRMLITHPNAFPAPTRCSSLLAEGRRHAPRVTAYARGLLSAMRPERGGMAITFVVLNLQGMMVSTDGHPNSSPTPARQDLRGKDHRIGRQRANTGERHDEARAIQRPQASTRTRDNEETNRRAPASGRFQGPRHKSCARVCRRPNTSPAFVAVLSRRCCEEARVQLAAGQWTVMSSFMPR